MRLIAHGLRDDEIADLLFVSARTVHSHVRTALTKTQTRNRTALAVLAVYEGVISLDEAVRLDPVATV